MVKVYGKTNGHHCFWLTINGKAVANFDKESDVDEIIDLQSKIKKVSEFVERVVRPAFSLAELDYPVSFGPRSNSAELEEIIKLIN